MYGDYNSCPGEVYGLEGNIQQYVNNYNSLLKQTKTGREAGTKTEISQEEEFFVEANTGYIT